MNHRTPPGKWWNLFFLCTAELLAMGLWFSASAVIPQLHAEWELSPAQESWLTMSVQLGFAIGALASAILNLPDRISPTAMIAWCTLGGALATAAIPLGGGGPEVALGLRLFTGITLAGVYPPGMKVIATWFRDDRGLGIGFLVGALTVGSAFPHFLNAVPFLGSEGMPPWRPVLLAAAALAAVGALLVARLVRHGPLLAETAPFNWRFAGHAFTERPLRLANFGYLGHMWELYAMWTWVPLFLIASYEGAGFGLESARLAGFGAVAAGGLGSVLAGALADRWGRCMVTMVSMAVSGSCALVAGFFFPHPVLLTGICLVWGFAVVADSAQFSTAISELSDSRYVGTALTIQVSLGFLLTLVTIHVIPVLVNLTGWRTVFIPLALGPGFGIWSMWRLRSMPEAVRMAGGRR